MRNKKKFDSVKMMREIRDKISIEFKNLDYDGQKKYIDKKLKDEISTKKKTRAIN